MSPEAQRIAIAEACGWTECYPATKTPHGFFDAYGRKKLPCGSRKDERLPDYLNDLNAMHEAEDNLLGMNKAEFAVKLCRIVGRDWPNGIAGGSFAHIHATAAQRAEAFLCTLGKWEEAK
jgi:hypothetical protein